MPRARKHLVCVADTPYYHVTARCVRRAFLCGVDRYSGQSYEHRRNWVEDRIRILSSVFSISVCAYAVMSNHYHLVVRLDPQDSEEWTDAAVLDRWTTLFRGPLLVQRHLAGDALSEIETQTLRSIISVCRDRLANLSWFMKCLNEPIARRANAEDRCTGHFWESRFHSQALKSDQALIAAMAYVDLNPVRAGIAESPEDSEYTSLRARLRETAVANDLQRSIDASLDTGEISHFRLPIRPLAKFSGGVETPTRARLTTASRLPIRSVDYFDLVDLTSRIKVRDKRGSVDATLDPILQRLGISRDAWPIAPGGLTRFLRRSTALQKKLA